MLHRLVTTVGNTVLRWASLRVFCIFNSIILKKENGEQSAKYQTEQWLQHAHHWSGYLEREYNLQFVRGHFSTLHTRIMYMYICISNHASYTHMCVSLINLDSVVFHKFLQNTHQPYNDIAASKHTNLHIRYATTS